MRCCVVIPHFDHVEQFRCLLPQLVKLGLPLIVIDDASPRLAFVQLQAMLDADAPGAVLIRHPQNQGKGGAVMTGLKTACEAGYTHAIQIDADGQHDVESLPQLRDRAQQYPASIICGEPVFDQSVPSLRRHARRITLALCWLATLSTQIRDALCGLRAYPINAVVALAEGNRLGRRMAFDPEILVRASWAGMELRYIPVRVTYPPEGRSHFRYLRDNVEIAWMHTRLLAGMIHSLLFQVGRV